MNDDTELRIEITLSAKLNTEQLVNLMNQGVDDDE